MSSKHPSIYLWGASHHGIRQQQDVHAAKIQHAAPTWPLASIFFSSAEDFFKLKKKQQKKAAINFNGCVIPPSKMKHNHTEKKAAA